MTDPAGAGQAENEEAALAALVDVPVGTIMPFAGDCANVGTIGKLGRKGWMPCDGSVLLIDEYPDLYDVIRHNYGGEFAEGLPVKYNLPDLSSQFVRGVNLNALDPQGKTIDPDVDSRIPSNPGGNKGKLIGSMQLPSTGAPVTPFTTEVAGSHRHQAHHLTGGNHNAFAGVSFYQAQNTGDTSTINSAGEHVHKIDRGGDAETRPASTSLFFIIKAY